MAEPSELARLQARLFRLVAQPAPVDEAARALAAEDPGAHPLAAWIAGGDEARAVERLTIYANQYFVRHRDALREIFAACAALAGQEAFDACVAAYLGAERLRGPSLDEAGDGFAAFLEREAGARGLRADLGSLAALERARREAFVGADAAPLRRDELARVPADDWPALRLALVPSARLVATSHAVEALWLAHDRGLAPPGVVAGPGTLAVWRRGPSVYHRALAPDEAGALARVRARATFAEVCEPFDEPERALELLAQWRADELFAAPLD
ncbi:MAG: putative DNA-binding domain-containing protein [Polyangiaceae bacterium]|nr:putative DNA-binding domain-containing protein [Polyangiaceae bacterium]